MLICCFSSANLIPYRAGTKIDTETLRVSFGLICLTFGREEVDSQSISGGVSSGADGNGPVYTPSITHSFVSSKRLQEVNALDALENASTCTGTTIPGELMK